MGGNTQKIIAFNYFGGKFFWLDNLYEYFPQKFIHMVDVFSGSMAVSLNYKGKCIKTANDINDDITNFFKVLRDHEAELLKKLELTPCSKSEYDNCWETTSDDIERARRFYVRVRQSFFGLGAQGQNKGWHMAKSQLNSNRGETVSRWNNSLSKLYDVATEIREDFQITNFDFRDCIEKTDTPDTFFYLDPPYDEETRSGNGKDYKYELENNDRIDLAAKLHSIKGKAMISGYPGGLTEELYKDWYMVKFPVKKNNIRSTLRKDGLKVQSQECIWMNYDPFSEKGQLKLITFKQ